MIRKQREKNEKEKFSYWDYIDKSTLIAVILVISSICLIGGAVYIQLTSTPSYEPFDPEPYHMGNIPDGQEWEFNATHVWRKGEG